MLSHTFPIFPEAAAAPGESTAPSRWPIALLGVAFDAVTMDEALARIEAMIATRRPHYVVTPNVDFLAQARHDADLRRILREADLVLCDGTPLVWASRWLGNPLPERVAGADLAPRLIARAAEKNYRLFFLGATPEANAQAVARLHAQYPGLAIAGHYAPPFASLAKMDHTDIVRRIRAAAPDILFVSFGCPKQEKWIAMHYRTVGVPVCLGVGAVIDFLAGNMRRAPRWMQRSGTEWLFRLAQEPRRLFRRYAHDLRFFAGTLLRHCWQLRWHAPRDQHGAIALGSPDVREHAARAAGRLDRTTLDLAADDTHRIFAPDRDCVLDLASVSFIDSTALAWLVKLHRQLRATGRRLILRSPDARVRRVLQDAQLVEFFDIAERPSTAWPHDGPQRWAA
jgi:N-acetylglucosaminyldiphosphoundecaprenol N-acetyl-beta-D-mannosaminyltransferase